MGVRFSAHDPGAAIYIYIYIVLGEEKGEGVCCEEAGGRRITNNDLGVRQDLDGDFGSW
jgi:hypothetical protein